MRRFELYIDKQVVGVKPTIQIIEFDNDTTDAEIEIDCQQILSDMISNEVDSGWNEI